MELPEIDLEELKKDREKILKEREEFHKLYIEWLKKKLKLKNRDRQQKEIID